MKKTFRTILAGAVALLAVSCYDDSAIRTELGKLDERVKAICVGDIEAYLAFENAVVTLYFQLANIDVELNCDDLRQIAKDAHPIESAQFNLGQIGLCLICRPLDVANQVLAFLRS